MINFEYFVEYFLLGAAGAGSAEVLKMYELRGKLTERKYRAALRSPALWIITFGMLMASGFIAWAVNAVTILGPWQVVLSGIGARALIRSPAEARAATPRAALGNANEESFEIDDLFR